MIVYTLNLIIVTIISKLSCVFLTNKRKDNVFKPNLILTLLIIIILTFLFALRWQVGTDFMNYYNGFSKYGQMDINSILRLSGWGYYALTHIIYNICPNNYLLYITIIGFLIYAPIILFYRKYTQNFSLTCFLYITTMSYYFAFNGTRQALAISICFIAFSFLFEKKYLKYFFVIIISSFFHSTTLILLPLGLIIIQNAWSKKIWVFVFITIITILSLPNLWEELISFLLSVGETKMVDDYSTYDSLRQGVSIYRILVGVIPVGISLIYYEKLKNKHKNMDYLINCSLLNALFLIAATRINLLARFALFFLPFNSILIPEFLKIFSKRERVILTYIMMILFYFYMCFLLPVDSDLLPYKWISII